MIQKIPISSSGSAAVTERNLLRTSFYFGPLYNFFLGLVLSYIMPHLLFKDVHLDAPIGIDTAECGPAQGGCPGVCSPKVFGSPDGRAAGAPRTASSGGGSAPQSAPELSPDASGGDGASRTVASVVGEISGRFGLSAAHATLLSTAAAGCPSESDRTPSNRIRGVSPVPSPASPPRRGTYACGGAPACGSP